VDFSLDLSKIDFPNKYKIMFGTTVSTPDCIVEDTSQILSIPPPEYAIYPVITQPIILNPFDEGSLELQIKSESETNSVIKLSSASDDKVNVTLSPNTVYLSPNTEEISKVKITTKNASIGTQTIRLLAQATFPESVEVNLTGVEKTYTNPVGYTIPISSNLTITVETPPPWYQPSLDVLNNMVMPLTAIATAVTIISGITGFNFWKKRSRKRRQRQTSNS
jgi:hypothetical protein